jgi:hypothetical protein
MIEISPEAEAPFYPAAAIASIQSKKPLFGRKILWIAATTREGALRAPLYFLISAI